MRFDILGAGSLGLLWAARLARTGHHVRLLLRGQEALQGWQTTGGRLVFEHDGIQEQLQVEVQVSSQSEPLECLVVSTKAYAAVSALESVKHRLGPESTVIMLQNGLGSQQQARQSCAGSRMLYASVTDGAWMPAPRHVVWAGKGITRIGDAAGGPAPPWLDTLKPPALDWVWETDIERVLWQKLAINCAINPFTTLHDCCNGDVPTRAGDELSALIQELQALLHALGYAPEAAELPTAIANVIRRTASNSSSMRQDVQAGRRTEIDYILGHACRTAVGEGVAAPVLERLHGALKTHLAMLGLPTN